MNEYAKGETLRTTRSMRFLGPDFPGYGDPNYADFYVELPAGTLVTVRSVEHHGSNPWTRYSVVAADGSSSSGVCPDEIAPVR